MSCCDTSLATEAVESERQADRRVLDELIAQSRDLGNGAFATDFVVPDLRCAGCIRTIEDGLSGFPGIERARVNLSLKRAHVVWREGKTDPLSILRAIEGLGFSAHADRPGESGADPEGRRLLVALGVAGFAAMNIMLLSVSVWSGAEKETAQLFHLISGVIAIPAVFFAGQPFFRSAYKALSSWRLNMDVPISLAVLLALAMSFYETLAGGEEAYFDAAVSLLFFLLIGRTADHFMRERARGAVDQLRRLRPGTALVVDEAGEVTATPIEAIEPGMHLRVLPGEIVPVDGTIATGTADFDRSLVTGETEPVFLKEGARLEAGIVNLNGAVDIKALSDHSHSFTAEITKLIAAAEGSRSAYVRAADRMAAIYAPAVHCLAAAAFIIWFFATGGDWQTALYTAIAVLIVTCPCALGLAVPVVHVIAATRLFREGVMLKDGAALERMAETGHVVFDKTGTLTKGTMDVSRMSGNRALFSVAYAMASRSQHPASKAITAYLDTRVNGRADDEDRLEDFREVPGGGLETSIAGRRYRLGNPAFVREINPSLAGDFDGAVTLLAGEEGAPLVIERTESLRDDALDAVDRLRAMGFSLSILSGDAQTSVARVAHQLRISDYSGGKTPEDKVARIKALDKTQRPVLMIGDGLNDAAALASGHASMAPASASDIGRRTADFVFLRDNLTAIPFTHKIATAAARLVKQNFGLAIIYNCIAVPLAMLGYVTPLVAAIAMSASSLVVVTNSMRLNLVNADSRIVRNKRQSKSPVILPAPEAAE
ncbi:MAG: heavy metal translocating P-type ATPase [Pseudomonadota bacterium]